MYRELTKQKRPVISKPGLLFTAVITLFSFAIAAQDLPLTDGENATCEITVNGKVYRLKVNSAGFFQNSLVVSPLSTVPIMFYYPDGKAGEKLVLMADEGGKFQSGGRVRTDNLDAHKSYRFNFLASTNSGNNRVLFKIKNDIKILEFLVSNLPPGPTHDDPDPENGPSTKGETKDQEGDPFNACTGNEFRDIPDLQIWGAVGEIPMIWERHGNSRKFGFSSLFGQGHDWHHCFQYIMTDGGMNDQGRAQLIVDFPEGANNAFTQNVQDTNLWLPDIGINKRLFQNGSNFFLQLPNGTRCRFEKLSTGTGKIYYQLQDIRDSKQNLYAFTYNNARSLVRITEPAGRYFKINYGQVNGLKVINSVSTNDGRIVKYHYSILSDDTSEWVILDTVSYGDKTKAFYTYSQAEPGMWPNLEHAIDPRETNSYVNMKYTYDDTVVGYIKQEINGKTGDVMVTLTKSFNERTICYSYGRTHTLTYPHKSFGNLGTYIDGIGRITKYVYFNNGKGFTQRVSDPSNRVTIYDSVSVYNNPLRIIHPDKSKEKWTRDNLDLILTHTDELGRVTIYTRDANHQVSRIDYPDGSFETFSFNQFGQVLDHTRRNGGVEHSLYDTRGLRTSYTDAEGNTTIYTYDGADRLASKTDARGNITSFLYNEKGLLLKTTYADGSSKAYGYDTFGNQITMTDELHHTWIIAYDEFRRPITKTDPLGRVTQYFYDLPGGISAGAHATNTPTKIISPGGKIKKIEYDMEWQKINEIMGAGSPDEAITSYEYNLAGNLVTLTEPKGNEWTYEYDKRDRKTASTDPLANRTEYKYDKAGNLLTTMRPDNGTTSNIYDNMNRLIQTIDPKGQVTKMSYDAEGNMTELTDAKNHTYSFNYDLLNRKIKMSYPLGSFESYTYDEVSNLKTYTNRKGDTRTYIYDSRNREINSLWSDATPAVSRTYDSAGRVLNIVSNVSALSYTYNSSNELASETQTVTGSNVSKTVGYDYNADGLKQTITYPSGINVRYRYNGRNLLDTISVNNEPPLAAYVYDLNGNRMSKKLDNGTLTNYVYDSANRMLSVDNLKNAVSFARFDYGYDKVNRRTYMQRDNDKGDVYAYDLIDQVTGVQYGVNNPNGIPTNAQRTVNYNLDSVGNRTTITDNGTPTNYISNALNQYTSVGVDLPGYDPNGNLTSFNGWTYTYDAQNRMTQATKGNNTVQCFYDPVNRCVKRIINGTLRLYYFDGWSIIQERSVNDASLPRYINGVETDEILKKTTATDSFYCHYDALGSVARLTNKNGNVIEKYSYDVFGAPTIQNNNGDTLAITAFGNRFMFSGREYIKEINLYDYRNRMHSPALGRFLQTDALRFDAEDVNFYRYVSNNPMNLTDIFGYNSGKTTGESHKNPDGSTTTTTTTNNPDGSKTTTTTTSKTTTNPDGSKTTTTTTDSEKTAKDGTKTTSHAEEKTTTPAPKGSVGGEITLSKDSKGDPKIKGEVNGGYDNGKGLKLKGSAGITTDDKGNVEGTITVGGSYSFD